MKRTLALLTAIAVAILPPAGASAWSLGDWLTKDDARTDKDTKSPKWHPGAVALPPGGGG